LVPGQSERLCGRAQRDARCARVRAGGGAGPAAHVQAARARALEAAFSDSDDEFDADGDPDGAAPDGARRALTACLPPAWPFT
jgi:hypothetical protein